MLRNKTRLLSLAVSVILVLSFMLAACNSASTTTSTTSNPPPTTSSIATQPTTFTPATTSSTSATISTPFTTSSVTTSPVPAGTTLNGAGGTFIAPLATKWFAVYNQLTGVKVNYQAVGSGAGINQITAGTVDFGESDAIMTAAQQSAAEAAGGPILHIPMTSGAVAVIYNLSGIPSGTIKLTSDVLAKIYLKQINYWDDPAITALNPAMNLPHTAMAVVHRSDGSGTTFIFTNYLSKVSSDWKTNIGNATTVNWPGDIGGTGNAGVAAQVSQTPGAIGYVELAYAVQNKLSWVLLRNQAGNYEAPSLDGVTKATVGVTLPDDMRIMITDSTNPDAYPICGFTWVLAYVNQKDKVKGTALVNMLWWAIHDGQQYGTALNYAPLSGDAVKKAEAEIEMISFQGHPLLTP